MANSLTSKTFAYLVYWARMLRTALSGSRGYKTWLLLLLLLSALGGFGWYRQLHLGLITTNMTDHVSWGIWTANFVYFVGVAAGAAVLVVPAYLYRRADIKRVVLLGELLAIAAIVMCMLFIIVDLGRPDRMWHLAPFAGKLNLPSSLLAWDVVVVSGYLLLNLHIPGYQLYQRYCGRALKVWAYLPFVFLSMAWALSIHTVTAFLLSGLGSRPFWNTPILAPRFLISAGASAPAILTLLFTVIKRTTALQIEDSVFEYFREVLRITMPVNLFLLGCEIFQEFYTGSLHAASAYYLYFGLHGHATLPAFIWTAILFNVTATTVFVVPRLRNKNTILYAACGLTIVGIWIEKGMGLIFPGFVPNPLGEIVEYAPNANEIVISVGIVAFGMLLYTLMARVTIAILTGKLSASPERAPAGTDAADPTLVEAAP